jgi:hypothetical protein
MMSPPPSVRDPLLLPLLPLLPLDEPLLLPLELLDEEEPPDELPEVVASWRPASWAPLLLDVLLPYAGALLASAPAAHPDTSHASAHAAASSRTSNDRRKVPIVR